MHFGGILCNASGSVFYNGFSGLKMSDRKVYHLNISVTEHHVECVSTHPLIPFVNYI